MSNKFSERNNGDQSLRQKARGLDKRMTEIEEGFGRLMVGIYNRFNQVSQMFGQSGEIIEALVEYVGAEQINEIVAQKRMERAEAASAAEKKALDEAIADGYVTPAEEVAEDAFIVGFETGGDGKPLGTGRQQVAFKSLQPAYKEQLLGKKVGEVVKTPTGGDFEVKEVYHLDEEKGRAILLEKQEQARKAAEEAQKQAEAAAAQDEAKNE